MLLTPYVFVSLSLCLFVCLSVSAGRVAEAIIAAAGEFDGVLTAADLEVSEVPSLSALMRTHIWRVFSQQIAMHTPVPTRQLLYT